MAFVIKPWAKAFAGNRIPYRLDSDLNNDARQAVESAIDYFSHVAGLRFASRGASGANPYLHFKHWRNEATDYCQANYKLSLELDGLISISPLLAVQTKVLIRLQHSGCTASGAAHEILHGLGFIHEHQRWDRDDWIKVHNEHIEDGQRKNFWEIPIGNPRFTTLLAAVAGRPAIALLQSDAYICSEYDYCSVMHYSSTKFASKSEEEGYIKAFSVNSDSINEVESSKTQIAAGFDTVCGIQYSPSFPYLFLLSSNQGTFQTLEVSSDGSIGDKIDGGTGEWHGGWTHALQVSPGDRHYLIIYNSLTGDIHINRLEVQMTASTGASGASWKFDRIGTKTEDARSFAGFTSVTSFGLSGRAWVLKFGGTAVGVPGLAVPKYEIREITPMGRIRNVSTGTVPEGGSLARSFVTGETPFVLIYNQMSGVYRVHQIEIPVGGSDNTAGARIGGVYAHGLIEAGLEDMVICLISGRPVAVFLNSEGGEGKPRFLRSYRFAEDLT